MIFVDTSIWVAAFRASTGPEAAHLTGLLDADVVALAAPVRIEILAGASARARAGLRRSLSALPLFHPSDATWRLVDEWLERAGDAGERFGFADLLIGAIAAERHGSIWSLGADFSRMERLGLLACHRP